MPDNWITISQTGGTGNATVTFTASTNTSAMSARTATLRFKTSGITVDVQISQAQKPAEMDYISITYPQSVYIPYSGGTVSSVPVTAYAHYDNYPPGEGFIDVTSAATITYGEPVSADCSTVTEQVYKGLFNFNVSYTDASGTTKDTNGMVSVYQDAVPEANVIEYNSSSQIAINSGWSQNILVNNFSGGSGVIVFDGGIITIPEYAFIGQSGLTSLSISSSITSINSYAFSGCSGLTTINYAGTIDDFRSITKAANWRTGSGVRYIVCSDGTLDLDSPNVILYVAEHKVPDDKIDYTGFTPTTAASCHTFSDSVGTISFFPIGLNTISGHGASNYVFKDTMIDEITIPEGVHTLNYAFYDCPLLKTVNIQWDNVSTLSRTFRNCVSLQSVKIPYGTTFIPGWCFVGCYSLSSVTIPVTVTSIGTDEWGTSGHYRMGPFVDCPSLTALTYEGTVEQWNNNVTVNSLYGNYNGTYVPKNFKGRIKQVNCIDGIVELTPETTTPITPHEHLIKYYGGGGVNFYDTSTFEETSHTSNPIFYDGIEGVTSYLFYTYQMQDFPIFSGNTGVTRIDMTGVDYIDYLPTNCFKNCSSLSSVTLSDSIPRISDYAFQYCASLTNLNYNGTMAQWNQITKSNNWSYGSSLETIHCTDGDITV